MDDTKCAKLLTECGLKPSEALIMTHLFATEAASAGRIARQLKLKRPTVYLALEGLVEQGLVQKRVSPKTLLFSSIPLAETIKRLRHSADVRHREIKSATESLTQLAQTLPSKRTRTIQGFEIDSVTGEKGVYEYMYSALTETSFCGAFDPSALTSKAKKVTLDFLSQSAERKTPIREFVRNSSEFTWYKRHITNPNHHVKPTPRAWTVPCDLIITERYLMVTSYQGAQESGLRIWHEPLVTLLREWFDRLWQISED